MTKHLKTFDDVVQELGGPEEVVKLVAPGKSSSLFPTWKWRGKFPTKTIKALQGALHERDAVAPDSLWGL